jgi:hypothetical protein
MQRQILALILFSVSASAQFPHDVLLECTSKMQRMGYERQVADESCAISAGESCSEVQAAVIQKSYPSCVGELIYMGIKNRFFAFQFCNLAASRSQVCQPQKYIVQRELFAACVYYDKKKGGEVGDVLNRCLEKILLNK